MRTLAIISCLLTPCLALAAPAIPFGDGWTLTPAAQIRPRLIIDSGRDFIDGDLAERIYVTQRSRLGVDIARADGLRAVIQLQDVRIWGEETNTLDFSAAGLDLHQAYADIPLADGMTLRLGRQEMVFDDSRLIGNVGWTQRARAFDAARLTMAFTQGTLDLFGAIVRENDLDRDGNVGPDREPASFGGVHLTLPMSSWLRVAPAFYTRLDDASDEARHTMGAFVSGGEEGTGYEAQFWYQMGTLGPADDAIGAMLGAVRFTHALDVGWTPTLTVWGEFVSGDGTVTGAFDTLYATNHKFYGEMDRFINVPASTGLLGLVDVGGRIGVAPGEHLWLRVDAHHLRSAEPDGDDNSTFGTEIDASVKWSPSKAFSVRALYGIFMPDSTLKVVADLPDNAADEHLIFVTTTVGL